MVWKKTRSKKNGKTYLGWKYILKKNFRFLNLYWLYIFEKIFERKVNFKNFRFNSGSWNLAPALDSKSLEWWPVILFVS